ncbi:hypothetical protein AVO42_02955 [Thiomicrospira sp. XS5]|uniref:hypothetical protein n=1 Tax=Thiomicrospira sp. XS5 TaxID=1775636 RepID=UPI000746D482|nr:hypothetical protein [Thiomicrospira sp. XS5]KUJ74385.1 hypothetical protein AVO42_02955 [Thiomicrospira sp. XS5]
MKKNESKDGYKAKSLEKITKIPFLKATQLQTLVLPEVTNKPWPTSAVYRKGYERGFEAPFILIPQGLGNNTQDISTRLKACYCTQSLSFTSSLQSIKFEERDSDKAKFLTVLLNSSLVTWYLFHSSSVIGIERDKVPQSELLDLPFPATQEALSPKAKEAFGQAVALMDSLLNQKDNLLKENVETHLRQVDKIIYNFFELDESDICIIENTVYNIMPSVQPASNPKKIPPLWSTTNTEDWERYSKWLTFGLSKWIGQPKKVSIALEGYSSDLVILKAQLLNTNEPASFSNENNKLTDALSKVWETLPKDVSRNFQLIPDIKIFVNDALYIVKPRKRRFWLTTSALADADSIASTLYLKKGHE